MQRDGGDLEIFTAGHDTMSLSMQESHRLFSRRNPTPRLIDFDLYRQFLGDLSPPLLSLCVPLPLDLSLMGGRTFTISNTVRPCTFAQDHTSDAVTVG